MRDWLLIHPGHGEQLQHMARVESHVFRSGDGEQPEPGDLKAAVTDFAKRLEDGRHENFSFVIVPLIEARVLSVSLSQRYGIDNISSLDLGLHVD
ncbi:MAG TPA: hypothetical protein VLA89_00035 [Gemmatimonadales bacterium]|nr:hypothetical protein [Gemmatimonadales bacterium]